MWFVLSLAHGKSIILYENQNYRQAVLNVMVSSSRIFKVTGKYKGLNGYQRVYKFFYENCLGVKYHHLFERKIVRARLGAFLKNLPPFQNNLCELHSCQMLLIYYDCYVFGGFFFTPYHATIVLS